MSRAPWYAAGLRFRCQPDCGACCKGPEPGWVVVRDEDAERLAAALGISLAAFARRYLRRVVVRGEEVLSLVERRGGDCIFWEEGAGCQVYSARPLQCRQWPFWPEVIARREDWEAERCECPGIDAPDGRLYTCAEIERIAAGRRGTLRGRKPRPLPTARKAAALRRR